MCTRDGSKSSRRNALETAGSRRSPETRDRSYSLLIPARPATPPQALPPTSPPPPPSAASRTPNHAPQLALQFCSVPSACVWRGRRRRAPAPPRRRSARSTESGCTGGGVSTSPGKGVIITLALYGADLWTLPYSLQPYSNCGARFLWTLPHELHVCASHSCSPSR